MYANNTGLLFPENAETCKGSDDYMRNMYKAKYERLPKNHLISETTIPSFVGEILHIDIYSTDQLHFLTCIDKFSKFAVVQPIQSRTIADVKKPLLQLINLFPSVKTIYCDNEKSLNSETVRNLLHSYNIEIANSSLLHSTSNEK